MSKFSGKCDLFDHIMMLKHRTKDGSDKKEDLDKVHVYYSDEMECFEIFKERTKGEIYKYIPIVVTENNQDLVAKRNRMFEVIPHIAIKKDKRFKSGQKEITTYTYKYYNEEYPSLKELNKKRIYILDPIKFKTLLDIIPYYSHIVSVCASDKEKEMVVISTDDFVDSNYKNFLKYGLDLSQYKNNCKEELQRHYVDVVERYYNTTTRKFTNTFLVEELGDKLVVKIGVPLDDYWDVKIEKGYLGKFQLNAVVLDYDLGIVDVSNNLLLFTKLSVGDEITLTYVVRRLPKLYLE